MLSEQMQTLKYHPGTSEIRYQQLSIQDVYNSQQISDAIKNSQQIVQESLSLLEKGNFHQKSSTSSRQQSPSKSQMSFYQNESFNEDQHAQQQEKMQKQYDLPFRFQDSPRHEQVMHKYDLPLNPNSEIQNFQQQIQELKGIIKNQEEHILHIKADLAQNTQLKDSLHLQIKQKNEQITMLENKLRDERLKNEQILSEMNLTDKENKHKCKNLEKKLKFLQQEMQREAQVNSELKQRLAEMAEMGQKQHSEIQLSKETMQPISPISNKVDTILTSVPSSNKREQFCLKDSSKVNIPEVYSQSTSKKYLIPDNFQPLSPPQISSAKNQTTFTRKGSQFTRFEEQMKINEHKIKLLEDKLSNRNRPRYSSIEKPPKRDCNENKACEDAKIKVSRKVKRGVKSSVKKSKSSPRGQQKTAQKQRSNSLSKKQYAL